MAEIPLLILGYGFLTFILGVGIGIVITKRM